MARFIGEIMHDIGLAEFEKKHPDLFKKKLVIQKENLVKQEVEQKNSESEKIKSIGKKAVIEAQTTINETLDYLHKTTGIKRR